MPGKVRETITEKRALVNDERNTVKGSPRSTEAGGPRWAVCPRPLPERVWEGLHAILGHAIASTKEGHPAHDAGNIDHTAPCLPHQGQHTQGHINHPQQVHVQNLHKVLFGQPLVGCSGRGDASIIHQTPEPWEQWRQENNSVPSLAMWILSWCQVTFRPGRTLGERLQWEQLEQRLPCSWGFRETRPSEQWEDRRPASLLTQSSHPTQCLVTRNWVTRNHSLWMQVLSFRSSVPIVWNLRMKFWMFTIHIAFADIINIPLTFQIFWPSAQQLVWRKERKTERNNEEWREREEERRKQIKDKNKKMNEGQRQIGWGKEIWSPRFGGTGREAWYWPVGPGPEAPASILSHIPTKIWEFSE